MWDSAYSYSACLLHDNELIYYAILDSTLNYLESTSMFNVTIMG